MQVAATLLLVLLLPFMAEAQSQNIRKPEAEFKKWESLLRQYKGWLDSVGASGYRFWVRLDSSHRPHRLYVGEGFDRADYKGKQEFVETFSRFLAGHPEKYMLIDLYDGTNTAIGEFGWGGFKLYPNYNAPNNEPPPAE